MSISTKAIYKVNIYFGCNTPEPAINLYWYGIAKNLEYFGMFIGYWNFHIRCDVPYWALVSDLGFLK